MGTSPNMLARELKTLADRVLVVETEFKSVKQGIRWLLGLTGTVLAALIANFVFRR